MATLSDDTLRKVRDVASVSMRLILTELWTVDSSTNPADRCTVAAGSECLQAADRGEGARAQDSEFICISQLHIILQSL